MIIQLRIHWLMMLLPRAAVPRAPMPMPLSMPLDDDVSFPPRKHARGQAHPPPGCAGVGRGGGMVSRASGTPIYILIYILSFISQIPVTYT